MSFEDDTPPTFSTKAWARAIAAFADAYPGRSWSAIPYTIQCAFVAWVQEQERPVKAAAR